MTETIVRLASPEDRGGLEQLCVLLHQENGLFPLSERKLGILLDRYYNREMSIIGAIGDVGAPLACISLSIDNMYYSDSEMLVENFVFVHPDHRRTDFAKKLLKFAKGTSDALRIPLMIGILSNQRTQAKIRLYERELEKAGAYFIYNRQFAASEAWDQNNKRA